LKKASETPNESRTRRSSVRIDSGRRSRPAPAGRSRRAEPHRPRGQQLAAESPRPAAGHLPGHLRPRPRLDHAAVGVRDRPGRDLAGVPGPDVHRPRPLSRSNVASVWGFGG
jgi:hypothetical protein